MTPKKSKTAQRILLRYMDLEFEIRTIEMKLESVNDDEFVKHITETLNGFRKVFDKNVRELPDNFDGDTTEIDKEIERYAEEIQNVYNEVDNKVSCH